MIVTRMTFLFVAITAMSIDGISESVQGAVNVARQSDGVFIKIILIALFLGLSVMWFYDRKDREKEKEEVVAELRKLSREHAKTNAILFFNEHAQVLSIVSKIDPATAQKLIDRLDEVGRLVRSDAGIAGPRSS